MYLVKNLNKNFYEFVDLTIYFQRIKDNRYILWVQKAR
jgi:hypothetical protein